MAAMIQAHRRMIFCWRVWARAHPRPCRMYAERKGIALEHVSVSLKHDKINAVDCA
jgi:hypothetical protein